MIDHSEARAMGSISYLALSGALWVGCSGGGPPSPSTGVAGGAAPTATGVIATVASASASAADPLPAPPESPFVAVAELPYGMRLFSVEGVVLGVGEEPVVEEGEFKGLPMGVLDGDRFVDKPELRLNGLVPFVVGAVGTWPAGVDLLVTGTTGRTGIAEHYVMTADAGWSRKGGHDGSYYAGVAKVGASTVALEAPSMPMGQSPAFQTVRGPKLSRTFTAIDPACKRQLAADGFPPQFAPKTHLSVSAFGGTTAGTLIAVGISACVGTPTAEIWEPDSVTSRTQVLEGSTDEKGDYGLVLPGAGADDAWIFYQGVYHYEARTLKAWPKLPGAGAIAAAVGPGAEVFVVTPSKSAWSDGSRQWEQTAPSKLWRSKGGPWAEVPLPAPPSTVVSDAAGTLWVVAGRTLLRTRKSASEASIVVRASAPTTRLARALLKNVRPPGPMCPTNLVVLYGFTKVTPDDYDFPATRKALKGHLELGGARFVVARDGGQKFFSAIVPDVTAGRKLVALIEKEVAGAKPQLVCADPEVLREVRIDLRTGEVQK